MKKIWLLCGIMLLNGCASYKYPSYDQIRQELDMEKTENTVYCSPDADHVFFEKLGLNLFSGPQTFLYKSFEEKEEMLKSKGNDVFKEAAKRTKELLNGCYGSRLKPGEEYDVRDMIIKYNIHDVFYKGKYITNLRHIDLYFMKKSDYIRMSDEVDKMLKAAEKLPENEIKKEIAVDNSATKKNTSERVRKKKNTKIKGKTETTKVTKKTENTEETTTTKIEEVKKPEEKNIPVATEKDVLDFYGL